MAQFRTTADILDLALEAAGEVTNGNSPYEAQALNYLNRVHFTLIAGGTIPIGKDQTVEIDELWPWARATRPLILELQPKYNTGTITLTAGSEVGAFSSGPTDSLAGWHLQPLGKDEWFRIASHTAGATAFEIDGLSPITFGGTFIAAKLEYELAPSYLVIDSTNNKIQFQKAAASPLTGTLTAGSYTPADLATHVAAVITAAAGGPTVTGAYSAITRKFTLTSNLVGPTLFQIIGNGDQSAFSVHRLLGYDDVTTTSAAVQTSTYILGGICRLVEPFKIHRVLDGSIGGVDAESFQRNYPITQTNEGFPSAFSVIRESAEGTITVRFNRFPLEKTRIEIEYVPVPRDLKDDATSIPLVPRKHVDVLEDAATFYIMLRKNDDQAPLMAQLVQGKLKAMVSQNRGSLLRSGGNFGRMIPRLDQMRAGKRRFDIGGGYT